MLSCVYFTDQEFNYLFQNFHFFAHLFKFQILEISFFSVVHFQFEKTEQNLKLLDIKGDSVI